MQLSTTHRGLSITAKAEQKPQCFYRSRFTVPNKFFSLHSITERILDSVQGNVINEFKRKLPKLYLKSEFHTGKIKIFPSYDGELGK